MRKGIILLITAILVSINVVFAQELSPARVKEINKAVSKLEAAINSQSNAETKQAEQEIQKIGKDVIPSLEKLFTNKSKDNLVRHKAMEVAAKLKDEKVTGSFLGIAKDKSEEWYHRRAALEYIGLLLHEIKKENKSLDKKYMKDMEELFNDSNNHIKIREGALGLYGQIGQNDALPVLIAKLNDPTEEIKTNAVYGIGAVRTPEGEEALIQGFLKNKGKFPEGPYVHLFGFYKIKKAAPYLIQALKELKGKSMQIIAIRGMYIKTLGELGDKSAIPILKEFADNPDVTYSSLSASEHAAIALAKMGDYETIKKVIKKVEIDGRVGVGEATSLRKAYKEITGQDFSY